jgi:hypothetical protein
VNLPKSEPAMRQVEQIAIIRAHREVFIAPLEEFWNPAGVRPWES